MAVIYADTLFVVNFSMDFLALYITGKSLHTPIRPGRLALAAALGALFATMSAVFSGSGRLHKLISGAAFVGCAFLMCLTSYSCRIAKSTAVFAAVNLGLGGMISAMCSWLRMSGLEASAQTLEPLTLILFGLIAGAASLIYGRFGRTKEREVDALIELPGGAKNLRLLSDSGNLLCEPISGKPVIVASPNALGINELTPENVPEELQKKLRAIPSASIAGKRLIYGFTVNLTIDRRAVEAIVAPVESDYGGFDGIIPENLI